MNLVPSSLRPAHDVLDLQLDALAHHVADLESAPADLWKAVALPLAAAINALNEATGTHPAGFATRDDAPVLLARQLAHAVRRRKGLVAAS